MNVNSSSQKKVQEYTEEVSRDKVVRLRFRIQDESTGKALQYGDDLFYLHGGYGGAFPKVELAMEGRRIGERVEVKLAPEEGYGYRQPDLVLELPSTEFAGDIPEAGSAVEGQLPDGRSMTFSVSEISGDRVVLDANHPFADKFLVFDFEILDIRDSTESERAAGFAFDGMFC